MCRPYKAQLKLTSTLKLPTMVYLPLPPAPSFLLHKPHSHSHPIKRANPAPPTTTTTTTTPTPTLKAKMLVRSISLPELGFRPSARSLPPLNGGHDRRPASAPPSPHPGTDFEEHGQAQLFVLALEGRDVLAPVSVRFCCRFAHSIMP
jgi:hypothetical protein